MARRILRESKQTPLIVICSEGGLKSSEYYYFRNFSSRNLRIQFATGNSTDPSGMLEDLLRYMQNEDIKSEVNCRIFLVLDTDLDDKRIKQIKEIEERCKENNIEIITSSPTFEIWYLMHYRSSKLKIASSREVKNELKRIIKTYKETMNVYSIIKDSTNIAIRNSKNIEHKLVKEKEDLLISNPHSSIYKILEAIDEFKAQR